MARKPKSQKPEVEIIEDIFAEPFDEALSRRYLAYALSTITSRALPDVRDGLKPVHRRILYAMRQMKLNPGGSFKKSAKVVGEVMGNYHPHGDGAIYDALARLVQDFSVRIPLVDGQGNFGNIDGDNPAAMRYTESRMTKAAELLLQGIDEDTVDFRETYDGEDKEPIVLPAAFPNLLANGAQGIAVGMATSIPPHNVAELIDASIHVIKHPGASAATLMKYVQGPDLPTGGVCVESQDDMIEAYATGRGGFRVRARWEKEDLGPSKNPGSKYQIVVTEMPYMVQKSKLIEKIAELIQNKKLPILSDIRDESAEDIRLVLEPKSSNVDAESLMETVFKLTDLESRISLNLNVLDANGAPRVMSLRECLQAFVDHRQEVLVRGTKFRLGKIAHRLEVLGGYIIAYLNLDEVIRIIREEDDAKGELIKAFDLTDVQAEAILNMRLRSLRKLEEIELKTEFKNLQAEQKELKELLASEDKQWAKVTDQLREVKKVFDPKTEPGKRRTLISDAPMAGEISLDDLIEKEPVTVIVSEKGWVRVMKNHVEDPSTIKYKEGDQEGLILHAMSNDKVQFFATNGKFYTLGVPDLPGGRGHGEPIRLMIDLANDQDIISLFVYEGKRTLLLASSSGHGFFCAEESTLATTKKGKQVLNVPEGAEATLCRMLDAPASATSYIAATGSGRKLLIFPAQDLPTMTRGKGVQIQKFGSPKKHGLLKSDELVDAIIFEKSDGLSWYDRAGRQHSEAKWQDWIGKRAQVGKIPPKGFPANNRFD